MNRISHHIRNHQKYYQLLLIALYILFIMGLNVDVVRFRCYFPQLFFISMVFLVFTQEQMTPSFIRYAVLAIVGSFALQLVALASVQVFGIYEFGESLGRTTKGVPLMSSIFWWMVFYSTSQVSILLTDRYSDLVRALVGGLLVFVLYYFFEHSAGYLHIWFRTGAAPMSVYFVWFVLGVFFQLISQTLGMEDSNKMAVVLYFCLFAVFFIPYFFIH